MSVENVMITKLSQYIELIENLINEYAPGFVRSLTEKPFVFRGIGDHEYTLLPNVFRKQRDKIPGEENEIENYTYNNKEKSILQAFIHEASGYISIPPTNFFDWAEYAQHFGVPTRYLDWTSSPLVALFFSCKDNKMSDGAVWMLDHHNYHSYQSKKIPDSQKENPQSLRTIISQLIVDESVSDQELPLVYSPYYVDPRMSAQGSFFMVWGVKHEPFEKMFGDERYFMKLNKEYNGLRSFGTRQMQTLLFKAIIPSEKKQSLLRELDLAGVNEKTLFPGLDGVGRYVERRFRFDYNEYIDNL